VARLEVDPADFETVLRQRELIVEQLTAIGYTFVALDLIGYRLGSLNRSPLASRAGSYARVSGSALTREATHGS
jgi:PP-loop superfamily ATP-utilizing enzyme